VAAPLTATPLIGRRVEMDALRRALTEARAGRGSVMLLAGEPGSGKTRLLDEIAAEAVAAGLCCRWGRCFEGEGAPPLWPWIQPLRAEARARGLESLRALLGELVGELAPLLGLEDRAAPAVPGDPAWLSSQARARMFDCVVEVFGRLARADAMLLLLDDLHGADSDSLALLATLARSLAATPLLVVGAYRDAAPPQELLDLPATRLVLGGLPRAEAAELVAAVLGAQSAAPELIEDLHRRSAGNPLLLGALAHALRDAGGRREADLQGDALGLIQRYLTPLSAAARQRLRRASVFGVEIDAEILAAPGNAAGTRAALDEALAAGVLRRDEGSPRLRFAHALVRDALYAELSDAERAELHRQAGDALAARADAGERLTEIAHHYARALDDGALRKGAAFAQRAGDAAMRLTAFAEAERLYQLGLDLLARRHSDDPAARADLLIALGGARDRAGETGSATRVFVEAAEAARRAGRRDLLSRAALGYHAELGLPDGSWRDDQHVALLEEALAAWGENDHPLHAMLQARLAVALYFTRDGSRRADLCRRALAMARRLGDPRCLARVLLARHHALWGPDARQRLATVDELLPLLAHDERVLRATASNWRFADLLDLGRRDAIETQLAVCHRLAEETGQPHQRGWVRIFTANLATLEGRFAEAEAMVIETAAQATWLGRAAEPIFGIQFSVLRVLQGRSAEIVDVARAIAAQQTETPAVRAGVAVFLARAGRATEARAEFEPLADAIDDLPRDMNYLTALAHLCEAAAVLGDAARAAPAYERLLPYEDLSVTIGGGCAYFGCVAHYLGMAAALMGRTDVARRHLEAAQATYAALAARPWQALAKRDLGTLLLHTPGAAATAEGEDLLGAAEAEARALGMGELGSGARPASATDAVLVRFGGGEVVLRREADSWRIEEGQRTVHLRDSRGLHYLLELLRRPGVELGAAELGAAYGDGEASDGAAARARSAVSKRIRDAIARIRQVHPQLGRHLAARVETGAVCCYRA